MISKFLITQWNLRKTENTTTTKKVKLQVLNVYNIYSRNKQKTFINTQILKINKPTAKKRVDFKIK